MLPSFLKTALFFLQIENAKVVLMKQKLIITFINALLEPKSNNLVE